MCGSDEPHPKEVLPDWARRDMQVAKGDRVYCLMAVPDELKALGVWFWYVDACFIDMLHIEYYLFVLQPFRRGWVRNLESVSDRCNVDSNRTFCIKNGTTIIMLTDLYN
jgi:hypothetical protein